MPADKRRIAALIGIEFVDFGNRLDVKILITQAQQLASARGERRRIEAAAHKNPHTICAQTIAHHLT